MTLENLIGRGLYDGSFTPNETELEELIAVVSDLQTRLLTWLKQYQMLIDHEDVDF